MLRGDLAVQGIDYFETFSPVVKMETLRIALALIIMNKLKPLQVDVSTAYLHAKLDDREQIFVKHERPCVILLKKLIVVGSYYSCGIQYIFSYLKVF